jgi:hypothetical protein
MRYARIATGAVVIMVLVSAVSAARADNTRKGFIFGLGLGGGYQTYDAEITGMDTERSDKFALASDLRIGGGLNDQLILYYGNRMSWFDFDGLWADEEYAAFGVNGLGVSYFFKPQAPSLYLVGSVGIAYWMWPGNISDWEGDGFGFSAGIGYEFKRHLVVEGTLGWGQPESDSGGGKIDAVSILVTIGVLLY